MNEEDKDYEFVIGKIDEAISDKVLRKLLIDLTKIRACELLNTMGANSQDGTTIILSGTSKLQVLTLRQFIHDRVLKEVLIAVTAMAELENTKIGEKKEQSDVNATS